jgi:ABC-type nickel/cobalt efflux system permease component RcnA
MAEQTPRYVPADTNGGWPIAAGVVGLALVCIGAVWQIYRTTYKHPTDVSWQTRDHEKVESHGDMGHGEGAKHDSTHNAPGHDTTAHHPAPAAKGHDTTGHGKAHDGR